MIYIYCLHLYFNPYFSVFVILNLNKIIESCKTFFKARAFIVDNFRRHSYACPWEFLTTNWVLHYHY
jgi:hypothetical protein